MGRNEPFHVRINDGQYEFDILPDDARALDLIPDGDDGQFHLLHEQRAYRAGFVAADYAARQFVLRVNGLTYTVHIGDRYERLVQQLGLSVGGSQQQNTVQAPMPGLVLQVLVEPGQMVQKGDPLLLLEAMKMENVIKAAGNGQVKTIAVEKGAAVEKGQLLLEMEGANYEV